MDSRLKRVGMTDDEKGRFQTNSSIDEFTCTIDIVTALWCKSDFLLKAKFGLQDLFNPIGTGQF